MERVGVRELRQSASALLERVAGGVSLEITNRGRPVARLVPLESLAPSRDELISSGVLTPGRGRIDEIEPVTPGPRTPTTEQILAELRGER